MDVMEKLVELLNNSFAEQYEKRGLLTAPHTATDLIANSVTVLPCNVCDKIYYIDRFTHKVEKDTVKFLTITKEGIKPILTRHNIGFWDFYKLGKTVFFTREEAEANLPKPPKEGMR